MLKIKQFVVTRPLFMVASQKSPPILTRVVANVYILFENISQ